MKYFNLYTAEGCALILGTIVSGSLFTFNSSLSILEKAMALSLIGCMFLMALLMTAYHTLLFLEENNMVT